MTSTELKLVQRATPFIPFRIYYAGGPPVDVPHPDFLTISTSGRIAHVWLGDHRVVRIDIFLIAGIEEFGRQE